MFKKKGILFLLIMVFSVVTLIGCGKNSDSTGEQAPEQPQEQAADAVPVNTSDWANTPNGKILVSPQWVNAVVNGEAADTYENDKYMILEASWGPTSDVYKAEHIPGAYHFNTDNIETEANNWNLGPIDHVKASLTAAGITSDTTVIVYGNDAESLAGAARVVFALMWAGVEDVRILDGSLNSWKAAGYDIETEENQPTPVADFGVEIPRHHEYVMVTPQEVLEAQKDENFRLISIRIWDEFIGKVSGYSYIEGAGEPKGAVWGHCGEETYGVMNDYVNEDGTWKSFSDIEPMWSEWGITKDTINSFYCGTGWRACVPWLMAYMQGWENITLFDGGWYMWEMDKSLPVQKGDPR